jgi:hypothetical protein
MTPKVFALVVLFLLEVPVLAQSVAMISPDSIPFAPALNYGAGDGPSSVFCEDLDGDTDLGLAVVNFESNNLSILKNLTTGPNFVPSDANGEAR